MPEIKSISNGAGNSGNSGSAALLSWSSGFQAPRELGSTWVPEENSLITMGY